MIRTDVESPRSLLILSLIVAALYALGQWAKRRQAAAELLVLPQRKRYHFRSRLFGKNHNDIYIQEYKCILRALLPEHMLDDSGLLRSSYGGGERIIISSESDSAFYMGGVVTKACRHRVERNRGNLKDIEYTALNTYFASRIAAIGPVDVIAIGNANHRGVLAHETFHDIQGYLYDNHPSVCDRLFDAGANERGRVERWYIDPRSARYTGERNYKLWHWYPDHPGFESPLENGLQECREAMLSLARSRIPVSPRIAKILYEGALDAGRLELIPTLLSAASEGDDMAAGILEAVFSHAGLNSDFYAALPRRFS